VPWPVYSERLAAASNAAGYTTAHVPVGMRAVIKKIITDTGNTADGLIVVQTGLATVWTVYVRAAKVVDVVDVMGVAYGGEDIKIYMSVSGMACSCTGYLFEDPQQATRPVLEQVEGVAGTPPDDISREPA